MINSTDIGGTTGAEKLAADYKPARPRIYFAHPVTYYGGPLEAEALEAITRWIGEADVVNPAFAEYQNDYQNLVNDVDTRARAFHYWLQLAMTCDMCVFLPFSDGAVGSGVGAEINTFFSRFGKEARVYEWLPIEKHFRARDESYFAFPGRVLSIEETRARIQTYNRTK